jgi:hypothetical protein
VARDAQDRNLVLAVMNHLASKDAHTREIAEEELAKFPAQYSTSGPALAKSQPKTQPAAAKKQDNVQPARGAGGGQ